MSDYLCPTCGQEWDSCATASGRRCPKCLSHLVDSREGLYRETVLKGVEIAELKDENATLRAEVERVREIGESERLSKMRREEEVAALKAQVEAMQRRAEAAESDWQAAESESTRLKEQLVKRESRYVRRLKRALTHKQDETARLKAELGQAQERIKELDGEHASFWAMKAELEEAVALVNSLRVANLSKAEQLTRLREREKAFRCAEKAIQRWEDWWDRVHGQREPMPVRYAALSAEPEGNAGRSPATKERS